jgi:hypothetical protein
MLGDGVRGRFAATDRDAIRNGTRRDDITGFNGNFTAVSPRPAIGRKIQPVGAASRNAVTAPDRVFPCRKCGFSWKTELDGCPGCGADWKAIDVSHGPGCPKNLLEEAMDTPNGALVRRWFCILNAKGIGLTIAAGRI